MKYKMNRWMAFALIVCVLLVTMGCDELLNPPVDVTGVTITQDNQTLVVGDTVELTATVAPSDATNKDVTWSSDDEEIATVSSSGVVTAVAVGEATITVTTEDGEKIDSITVTVNSATIAVTGVTIAEEDQTILVGDTLQLTETVVPSDASNKNVTWTSDDEDVATVSSSGLVSAVAEGTATITVTTVDGGKTDSITITVNPVPIAVTGVIIAEEDQTILVGDTLQLTETVAPSDASNKNVTWTSDDEDVATVSSSGLVTAVAEGTATITVTTVDGGKTDSITITVNPVPIAVTGVTITEEDQTILVGDTLQLNATVSPNEATNKDVAWSSSDTGVATVSTTGLVTAVAAGSTTITVTTDDGSKTDTISLTVKNEHIIFTLTPTDTTLDTLHFELYSGAHADSDLAAYVDLSTTSEVPLATVMGNTTSLIGSTKPLDMPSGGQFAAYDEATNGSDIIYAYVELPLHTSATIDTVIDVSTSDAEHNYMIELTENDTNGDPLMEINAEDYTVEYSVIDTEAGYLEGTISGTVYDVTGLDDTAAISTGTEYTLNLTFKAAIVDVIVPE